jgi:hypothetical protein
MTARTCSDCPKQIRPRNASGRCRACFNRNAARDPAWRAKQRAGVKAKFADPKKRAAHIAMAKRNLARWRETDEGKARLKELGRNAYRHSQTPEARQRWQAGRAAAGRKRSDTVLAWCPPDRREEYRHLLYVKRLPAAEARAMIEADLSLFERQLHRVRMGARVIDKPVIPSRDYDYTLGGVSAL